MFVNIIKTYRDVVAVCDKELLGKVFEEPSGDGEVTMQLDVKESFYKGKEGKEVSEEEVIKIMKLMAAEDATFNIVGPKSVASALKAGIIKEENIGEIKGIPYTLILL
jgi:hypothetical protein